MNNIAKYYSKFAHVYFEQGQSGIGVMGPEIRNYFTQLQKPSVILDAGCGPGVEAKIAAAYGHQVIGLDISSEMLNLFRKNVPEAKAILGSIADMPLPDNAVDSIFASASFLHLDQKAGKVALQEFFRVLKPAGTIFLLTTVGEGTSENYTHLAARSLGLDGVFFYHWKESELREEFKRCSLDIESWNTKSLYEKRPAFLSCVLRKTLSFRKNKSQLVDLKTSWREESATNTLRLKDSIIEFAGISRISKIDTLAEIGLPIFSAHRPKSKISFSVFGGKGFTQDESLASALFEAMEVAAAEKDMLSRKASMTELLDQGATVINPEVLGCATIDLASIVPWVPVKSFENNTTAYSPSFAVGMAEVSAWPLRPITNGLASGVTVESALFHALLEVVERHAYSKALITRDVPSLNLQSIDDELVKNLLEQLVSKGLIIETKDLSQKVGLPCFSTVVFNPKESDLALINGGYGCHPDPIIAIRRSLCEALQSRATVIAGAREDLYLASRTDKANVKRLSSLFKFWYEPSINKVDLPEFDKAFSDLRVKDDVFGMISSTLSTVRASDPEIGQMYYYVFPSPKGTSVVRVILEGAEAFSLDSKRIGPGLRKSLLKALPLKNVSQKGGTDE